VHLVDFVFALTPTMMHTVQGRETSVI